MIETSPGASRQSARQGLRAWLRGGAFGPTELSRRGVILVVVSVVVVVIPVVGLTLLSVEVHLALKVSVLAVTVVALVGAALRVVADARPTPRGDLDRAGKVIGAVAALFTALAVLLDWGGLDL
ncbi:hypothetical protein GSU68_15960 [Rathayibacter sp. VKM Ac-2759]|uniref:hypothetical protein n=1 Tax=Rathayibacter sp. VKM Ac-2759 TaxID=2609252 RepID=UPI0013189613|nr:hypothetical protein [Rathayibacter sp. VKM Ac-2759]QHC67912.1 hypothetical protein GSU68_15960 [Rathayibacter sp. VKM Ac-2759]